MRHLSKLPSQWRDRPAGPRRQRSPRSQPQAWVGSLYARRLRVEALEDRRLLAVTMGFTGPYSLNNWTNSGIADGTTGDQTSVDGATGFFDYSVTLASGGVSQRTADLRLPISPVTGSITFDYAYTGNHRFFQAAAEFDTLVSGAPTTVVNQTTSGDFSFSGSATIVARAGQSFGFRIGGKNFDSDSHIDGLLTISNIKFHDSIVVDALGDVNDGNFGPGQLTLREAVGLANSIPGADTITFAPALSGESILLTGGELAITASLTIDATELATPMTIDAQQQSRVIEFSAAAGDLTLSGLTMQNGRTTGVSPAHGGGGISFLSIGTLTLSESSLVNSSTTGDSAFGGGIRTFSGKIVLNDSTLAGNSTAGINADGGAIFTRNNVTLIDSTISGNNTIGANATGGGIHSYYGAVRLTQSTVSGNSTAGAGAHGGGIYVKEASVTLESSTLSGNRTTGANAHGGGIVMSYGSVTLNSSTVTGNSTATAGANGGGVFVVSAMGNLPVRLANSILAGNSVPAGSFGPDLVPDGDSMLTVNFSLIGTGITPTAGGNNISTDAPLLGPLADNGGPTQTHALLPGSPALDAGDPAIVFNPAEFDQRGAPFVRVFGGRVDIGALEAISLVVNDVGAGDDGNIANGVTTLREAINFANAASGADVITFDPELSGHVILLGGAELEITDTLTIDAAPLDENVIIDAQQQSRVMNFAATTGDLTLAGLTMQNGRTTGFGDDGGGIRFISDGTLTLTESTVSANSTTGGQANGGGIYAKDGSVVLNQSTVSGNSTLGSQAGGGGIYTEDGDITLNQSTLSGNSSIDGDGGGINSDGGVVTLNQSTLSGNSTINNFRKGGAIYSANRDVTLNHSTVSGNSTDGEGARGGAIYATNGRVTLNHSTLSGNSTAGNNAHGGGIYSRASFNVVTLNQSTVSGNSTAGDGARGGAIFAQGSAGVTLSHSTLSGNRTAGNNAHGGGIYLLSSFADVTIRNSIVAGNTVAAGSMGPDLVPDPQSAVDVNFSLIGTGITPTAGGNNISTNAPLLGPRADNGGPTQTHALLPGSPALDAGDPNSGAAVHIYELNGSLADALGGPSLVVGGGFLTATGYQFGPNQGANLNNAVAADEYSIELVFSFDELGGYQKIIDSHDLADDSGLYSIGGSLHFYDAGPQDAFAEDVLVANVLTHLVVTRDGPTDVVAVYVDGVQVMSFVDSGDIAVFNGLSQVVRFFQDDNATGGSEAASGFVDRIRIYDRDLSDAEVGALVFDQRGAGFPRVADGDGNGLARTDIGAYEAQVKPSADFDGNTVVDGADILRWQRGLGAPNATRAQGDSDGDADADHSDLAAWRSQFGATGVTSFAAAVSAASQSSSAAQHMADPRAAALDALYAAGDVTSLLAHRPTFRPPGKTRLRAAAR